MKKRSLPKRKPESRNASVGETGTDDGAFGARPQMAGVGSQGSETTGFHALPPGRFAGYQSAWQSHWASAKAQRMPYPHRMQKTAALEKLMLL